MEPERLSTESEEPTRRVLIVDDEQSIRRLLNQWTVGLGYQCHQAADADEALADTVKALGVPVGARTPLALPPTQ